MENLELFIAGILIINVVPGQQFCNKTKLGYRYPIGGPVCPTDVAEDHAEHIPNIRDTSHRRNSFMLPLQPNILVL